jgi:organic radical activating enzyme
LKCNYCDTDFSDGEEGVNFSPESLAERVKDFEHLPLHSISLTGGEPLLQAEFLKKFLPLTNKKIYLETNATLADKLLEVKPFIDIVSADIKLKSASGENVFELHEEFFANCSGLETFAKIVFDENITDCEIENCANIAKKYGIMLALQPKMIEDKMAVSADFAAKTLDRFLEKYPNVRLIPQVHKFIGIL